MKVVPEEPADHTENMWVTRELHGAERRWEEAAADSPAHSRRTRPVMAAISSSDVPPAATRGPFERSSVWPADLQPPIPSWRLINTTPLVHTATHMQMSRGHMLNLFSNSQIGGAVEDDTEIVQNTCSLQRSIRVQKQRQTSDGGRPEVNLWWFLNEHQLHKL